MSADTITLTRQGDRWFAIDEETGLAASGQTRERALQSLDQAVENHSQGDSNEVAIVSTPDVLHGQPRIEGTRHGVFPIGESVRQGDRTVDDVVADYPDLTTEQVEVALAYYDGHSDEMAALREEEAVILRRIRGERRTR